MHTLAILSVTFLTLGLASTGAAAEPALITPATSSELQRELMEKLDRLQAELTEQLSRQLDDQLNAQSAAAFSRAMAQRSRSWAARRGTRVAGRPWRP